MLRDGQFLKEAPVTIGIAARKHNQHEISHEEIFIQSILLSKSGESSVWKTAIQKLAQHLSKPKQDLAQQ